MNSKRILLSLTFLICFISFNIFANAGIKTEDTMRSEDINFAQKRLVIIGDSKAIMNLSGIDDSERSSRDDGEYITVTLKVDVTKERYGMSYKSYKYTNGSWTMVDSGGTNKPTLEYNQDGYTGTLNKVDAWSDGSIGSEPSNPEEGDTYKVTTFYTALYSGEVSKTAWVEKIVYFGDYIANYSGLATTDEEMKQTYGDPYASNSEACIDPVNVVTGNFYMQTQDIMLNNIGQNILLQRSYNSLNDKVGILGKGWSLNYGSHLTTQDTKVIITYSDGRELVFNQEGNEYKTNSISKEALTKVDDKFVLEFRNNNRNIYDSNGNLVEAIDSNGNKLVFGYNNGYLTKISGESTYLEIRYKNNKIANISDHTGREISYTYDQQDQLINVNNLGGTLTYEYNNQGMISATDEKGDKYVKNLYDEFGRVIQQEDAEGNISTIEYNESELVNTVTVGKTNVKTQYYYNEKMYIIKKVFADGTSINYEYDTSGNKIGVINPKGLRTSYEYDDEGNLKKIVSPEPSGYEILYGYDVNNNISRIDRSNGSSTEYEYDNRNNLISKKLKILDGIYAKTTYQYDSKGRLIKIVDPEGASMSLEYENDINQPTQVTGFEGEVIKYTYDNLNRVSTINKSGSITKLYYDDKGNTIKIVDPYGNVNRRFYDEVGNLIKNILPEQYNSSEDDGVGTTFEYDGLDRRIKEIDPYDNIYRFFYDADGRKIKSILPNQYNADDDDGDGYEYEYDPKGNITKLILPTGEVKDFILDENGNVTKTINPREYAINGDAGDGAVGTYDELGRLIQITDNYGVPIKRFVYNDLGKIIKEMDAEAIKSADNDVDRYGTLFTYNLAGWLIQKKEPKKIDNGKVYYNFESYNYDKKGRLTSKITSDEYVLKDEKPNNTLTTNYTYNKNDRVTRITDSLGSEVSFEYDIHGNMIKKSTKMDNLQYNIVGYEYDKLNRVISQWEEIDAEYTVSDSPAQKRVRQYTYNKNGKLKTVLNPKGYKTEFYYDFMDRVIRIEEEVDADTIEQNSRVIKVTSPYLEVYGGSSYTYDVILDTSENIQNIQAELQYDPRLMDNIEIVSKQNGLNISKDQIGVINIEGNIEDKESSLVKLKFKVKENVAGNVFFKFERMPTFMRDGSNQFLTQAIGKVAPICQPDMNGDNIVDISDFTVEALVVGDTSNEDSFKYNQDLNPDGVINTLDLDYVKDWIFNEKSNLLENTPTEYLQPRLVKHDYETSSQKMLRTIEYTYDNLSNILSRTESNGAITNYEYDDRGRLKKYSTVNGSKDWVYDDNGNVIEENDEENVTTYYKYDLNNRLIEKSNSNNKRLLKNVYDDRGFIVEEIRSYGKNYMYDIGGRLVSVQTPEQEDLSVSTKLEYNALDYLTKVIDAKKNTTVYNRDLLGRTISVLKEDGIKEYYSYDNIGNIKSSTDGNGNVTSYSYTNYGDLSEIRDAKGYTTKLLYNELGELIKEQNKDGQIIEYTYNANSKLKTKRNLGTNDLSKYLYNSDGNLMAAVNNNSIKSFMYTETGLVKNISHNDVSEVDYSYNNVGQITSISDRSGTETEYSYNDLGLLNVISLNNKTIATLEYANNKLSTVRYGNGIEESYLYTKDDEIQNIISFKGDTEISNITYSYDSLGNLIGENDGKDNITYRYDKNNQLIEVESPGANEFYTYDKVGNRLSKSYGDDNYVYNYNELNQLIDCESNGDLTSYEYDKNGNMIKESSALSNIKYTYDGFNRLTMVDKSDGNWMENTYDGLNQRIGLSENGIHTKFVVDQGQVILEMNESDIIKSKEIYGFNRIAKQTRDNQVYYYHANRHGDITSISDANSKIINSYTYDSFGNVRESELETIQNRFLYAGEQYDEITGNYYLRARFYSPNIGRFTQEDTYRGDGLNLYAYVANNPLMYVDPSGHGKNALGNSSYVTYNNQLSQPNSRSLDRDADLFMDKVMTSPVVNLLSGADPRVEMMLEPSLEYIDTIVLLYDFDEKTFDKRKTFEYFYGAMYGFEASETYGISENFVSDANSKAFIKGKMVGELVSITASTVKGTGATIVAGGSGVITGVSFGSSSAVTVPVCTVSTALAVENAANVGYASTRYFNDSNDLNSIRHRNIESSGTDKGKSVEWTNHGYKHFPQKNLSWKKVVKSTKNGPAKYKPDINIEQLERMVWEKGTSVTNGKTWKVMEFDNVIGATVGKETRYMRVEMSAGTIHGHPITKAEYLKLLK